jgi:hypothetical protein
MARSTNRSIGWIQALAAVTGTWMVLAPSMSVAATNSSWSSQPSWAAQDPAAAASASHHSAKDKYYNNSTSPFSPGSNNIALDVGQVFLMGDLSSKYNDSIGSQLHYTYGVSDLFGFDSSIGYSEHSDGKFSMMTALMGLRTNLAWYDKVVPYALFGMGFYKPSFQTSSGPNGTGTVSSISPLLFGVHLGPGVDLELTRQIFFGAALTFHDVFGNTRMAANNQPIDVGGTYTTFFIHAGVTF